MAIQSTFSMAKLEEYLTRCNEIALDYTYQAMAYLAEECVNRVRDRSAEESWIDQTGNLRSSIGYIITQNGKVVTSGGFKPANAPKGNGNEGKRTGEEYANLIASRYSSKPIALVVVAGMEYAVFVEARDNKDVLAKTELWARDEWQKREPKLKAKIENAWAKLAQQMGIAT